MSANVYFWSMEFESIV